MDKCIRDGLESNKRLSFYFVLLVQFDFFIQICFAMVGSGIHWKLSTASRNEAHDQLKGFGSLGVGNFGSLLHIWRHDMFTF